MMNFWILFMIIKANFKYKSCGKSKIGSLIMIGLYGKQYEH